LSDGIEPALEAEMRAVSFRQVVITHFLRFGRRVKMSTCLWVTLLVTTLETGGWAQTAGSKADLTPAFWQRDPEAGFADEGRMHCAPTAVSDGLIYLAQHNGMTGLVAGFSHGNQIELIKELADDFDTDPSVGGTNPDKILTGLQTFASAKGYKLSKLELKTWRGVTAANKKFKIGTKPDLGWVRNAAREEDAIVILNIGWYYKEGDGYTRKGGHWIEVVGDEAEESDFIVRNPLLEPARQMKATSVTLTSIDDDLVVTNESGKANMKGYYEADGPGLPHGKTVKPILDAVIVFGLVK
jgi:hypothetical protein